MTHRPRNQRTCHCRNCGIGFLTFKATAFCGYECRQAYIAIHGTTKPITGANLDGASKTSSNKD